MRSVAIALALYATTSFVVPVFASEEMLCATDSDTSGAAAAAGAAQRDVRLLFITFPDVEEQNLPNWTADFISDFANYIATMSRGKQTLEIEVVTRSDQPAKAWVASGPSTNYASDYDDLNVEIMSQVDSVYPNYWSGVDHVIAIHYRRTFDPILFSGVVGVDNLGCGGSVCAPGFSETSTGTTQYIPTPQNLNGASTRETAKYIAGHEYGHTIGMDHHTPGSASSPSAQFGGFNWNPGRYDIMRASGGGGISDEGLLPYHAVHLDTSNFWGPKWLPARHVVTSDTTISVPDIRSAAAKYFEVQSTGSPLQRFLLINHQVASNPYDAKYRRSGLYIWHTLSTIGFVLPNRVLDLESADGRFTQYNGCVPIYTSGNADAGKDRLEQCSSFWGDSLDVFDGVTKDILACGTNPSTRRYAGDTPNSSQTVKTSIAFENIRPEGSSMVVDVFVTPRQKLTAPNSGGAYTDAVPISWTPRSMACITNVDILLSNNSGQSYDHVLAVAEPNDGMYVWNVPPGEVGDNYRVMVVSHDEANGVGRDSSDVDFRIEASCPPWMQPCDSDPLVMPAMTRITKAPFLRDGALVVTFDLPRAGLVKLVVYDVLGRMIARRQPAWMPARAGQSLSWRTGELASGVYVLRLEAASGEQVHAKFVSLP